MAELKRSLGYGTIIAISITSMVGTGMFVGPALAAQKYGAGNMSLISWGILSAMTLYISFCFGELVSMFPNSGGVYEFAKMTYGRFIAFIIGWVTWLVGNITTSVVIVTALQFLIPEGFVLSFLPNMSSELLQVLIAISFILVLNYIAYRGIDASAKILVFFATITVLVLIVLIGVGIFGINYDNFTPFWTTPNIMQNLVIAVLSLFFILETFFGWESATFLAEETKNASKIIPKSLIITSAVVAVLGFLFAATMLGNIPWESISFGEDITAPLLQLSTNLFPADFWQVLKIGVFAILLGAAAGGVVSTPRLILALSRDKLFINSFARVHDKYKTPHRAILFQTVITIIIVIIGFAEYETLLSMLVPMALIMYISVLLSVTILRFKMPRAQRDFKAPFGRIGPVILSLLYIVIIAFWLQTEPGAWDVFKLILSFILFGVPIYLLLLFYYDPDVIVKLNDIFAYFTLAFERVLIPKRIDRDIFNHLGYIEGRTVLEFGCGVGTFTKELAREVGEHGQVIATDVSYTQVKIANKRIAKRGHINVRFIHDIHQVNRVHHTVGDVDAIVSLGMLGYLQDIKKVLREMHQILPEGGKILFMDYVDLFKVIPNVSWLSNKEELTELFRECGFAIKVEKLKGNFWNYLFIYGIKTEHDVPYI